MADNTNSPFSGLTLLDAPAQRTSISEPLQEDSPLTQPSLTPNPSSAFSGLTLLDSSAPVQQSSAIRTPMTLEKAAESDEEPGTLSKAWDWLNAPLIDFNYDRDTGFWGGFKEVASGMTSPLSAGLMLGTFGLSSLFKSAGQVALKAVGMGADEIATFVKGAELLNKAKSGGQGATAISAALEQAGASRGLMSKGIQLLTDSGMTLEDITGRHILQRGSFALLRNVIPDLVTAQKVSKGIQALVDAGFTGMAAYSVVESSPRALDALKEGDYDEAARLATHIAAGSLFTALGAAQFKSAAGGLADEALVKMGFKIKPSQENLLLRKNQGMMRYDTIQRYALADKFEKELHEEFKSIGAKNIGSVMKLMESGMAPDKLVEQYNFLAESMGMPERKLPLMPRSDVRPSLPTGNPWLAGAADDFNRARGARPIVREFHDIDPRSADMAAAYDALKHDPADPAVKRSYDAYKSEVAEQFDYAAKKLGIAFEPVEGKQSPASKALEKIEAVERRGSGMSGVGFGEQGTAGKVTIDVGGKNIFELTGKDLEKYRAIDALPRPQQPSARTALLKEILSREAGSVSEQPYKSVADMIKDVKENKHLYVPRATGLPADHPLAELNPRTKLSYADMSRATHDLFGHVAEGFELDARGRENAWNTHRQMFSRAAVPAMTTETRSVSGQKVGLLPRDFWSRKEEIPDIPTREAIAAEEPTQLFHGTNVQAAEHIRKEGFGTEKRIGGIAQGAPQTERELTFLSETKSGAKWFAEQNVKNAELGGHEILPVSFKGKTLSVPSAKSIYDAAKYLGVKQKPILHEGKEFGKEFDFTDFRTKLKEAGYDAVSFRDPHAGGRKSVAVFNPKTLELSKSPTIGMADYITKTLQEAFAKTQSKLPQQPEAPPPVSTPISDALIQKYGQADNPAQTGFILSDGRAVPLPAGTTHDQMLASVEGQNREAFLDAEQAIRVRTRTGRAGQEIVLSIPRQGVTEDQLPKMKQAINAVGRNGRVVIETTDASTQNPRVVEKDFPRASDIDDMLYQLNAHPIKNPVEKISNIFQRVEANARNTIAQNKNTKGPFFGKEPTPEELQHFGVIGAIKMWEGTTSRQRWSNEMLQDYGDKLRPYLNDIFEQARKALFSNMPEGLRKRYETMQWSPNRVLDHIQAGKDYAILTAENPNNTRISPQENSVRTAKLLEDLQKRGYEAIPVEGNTKDVPGQVENVFFVPDITPRDAAELGRAHGQGSVLTREGLQWLKANPVEDHVNPADVGRLITGRDAREQDYFSVLRGPSGEEVPFSVPLNFSREIPAGAPAKVFLGTKLQGVRTVDQLDSSKVQSPSVAGVGTYLTESPQGASDLAGETGQVVAGVLRPDVKLLEGSEVPMPTVLADSLRIAFARLAGKLKPDSKPEDVFEMYKNSGSGSLNEPRLTYMDVMHAVRKLAGEKKEGIQAVKDFEAVLAKQGYDGVRFTQAGQGRSILLFPEDISGASISDLLRPAGPSSRLTPDEARAWDSPVLEDSVRYKELAARQYLKDTKNYTQKEKEDLLESYKQAINATPEMYGLAGRLRDKFSEIFEEANTKGVLPKSVEDYVTHVWGKDYDNVAKNELEHSARQDSSFHTNVSMARHRVFKVAFEGQLLAKKLISDNPIRLVAHEMRSVGEAIAARDFMDRLRDKHVKASDGRAMVALSGTGELVEGSEGRDPAIFTNHNRIRNIRIPAKEIERLKQAGTLDKMIEDGKIIQAQNGKGKPLYMYNTHDYRVIDHPAMKDWNFGVQAPDGTNVMVKGELRVHPEAYQYLNQILGREKSPLMESKPMKAVLKAGSEAKGILLSFDTFHVIQEGLRALMTGMSPFKIADFDPYDPVLRRLVQQGATFGKDNRSREIWQEGNVAGHSKLISKIPLVGDLQDAIQDFLFNKYIPGLKVRAARSLYERYKAANPEWELDKVARTAAADVNERFGGLNYRDMGRSAGTQDFLRLMTLAPDWLESELRFVKRVMTPGGEGQIARQDTIRMAAYLWAAARVMNYMNTGKPHNEAPFGVAVIDEHGKETIYSVRTLPTDMLHFAADPAGFLRGRSSPVVRAGTEIYTGRNNRDQKLTRGQVFVDVLRNAAPIPLQNIGRIAGEAPSDIGTSGQIIKAAGGTAMVYKTQAEKLAAELASDRSEQGPVEPAQLIRHQTKLHLEDEVRAGKVPATTIHQLVEDGQMSVKEAKEILKNVEDTQGMDSSLARMYTRAARLPMSDMLQIWDAAGNNEKAALTKLLIKKRINYYKKVMREMSPAERQADPTYRRLRMMFPNEAPF